MAKKFKIGGVFDNKLYYGRYLFAELNLEKLGEGRSQNTIEALDLIFSAGEMREALEICMEELHQHAGANEGGGPMEKARMRAIIKAEKALGYRNKKEK